MPLYGMGSAILIPGAALHLRPFTSCRSAAAVWPGIVRRTERRFRDAAAIIYAPRGAGLGRAGYLNEYGPHG
jgi:hypothetical protein